MNNKEKVTEGRPRQPFLRWAGSKRKLIPRLAPYWNSSFERYVEPFMGSACLFFAIDPPSALLSDLNPELIHTFRTIRDEPESVHDVLSHFPLGKRAYYKIREKNPKKLSPIVRAARFVYLNRFCFNGIYRTNTNGDFNVPYAPDGTGALPSLQFLKSASARLRKTSIRCGDFETILLREARANDFIYMDPPYAVSTRRVFREYGPKPFDFDDVERLAVLLKELNRRKAKFVASYAFTNDINKIFSDWNVKRIVTQRNVSGFAKHRRKAVEVLITNI